MRFRASRRLVRASLLLAAGWSVGAEGAQAWGQLRVVSYNTGGDIRTGFSDIVKGMALEANAGITKVPDIYVLSEQVRPAANGTSTTSASLVTVLNGLYGAGTYTQSTVVVGSDNDSTQTIVYRPSAVSVIGKVAVGVVDNTTSDGDPAGQARQDIRFQIRPVGYTSAADVYIYASHMKASDSTSDRARRQIEADVIRMDVVSNLPTGSNVILAGDLNVYSNTQQAYVTLTTTNSYNGTTAGRFVDPLGTNSWASVKSAHTQSPATTFAYSGQVTGGMDDRFDFQLPSAAMADGHGVAIIPGTYHTFGNNGTHNLNAAINQTNTSTGALINSALAFLNSTPGAPTQKQVLNALAGVTDHMPVMADYQLPARMSVSFSGSTVATSGALVLKNAAVSFTAAVANSAPVTFSNGADQLDFSVAASGMLSVSGGTTGSATAVSAAHSASFLLSTSTPGLNAGSVTITPTSEQVPDAAVVQSVTYTVVEGSNASFAAGADVNAKTIDFGVVRAGTTVTQVVSLFNSAAVSGSTAPLALTTVKRRQEFAGGITIAAAPFATLAGGSSNSFSASVDTSTPRTLDVSYQLLFSDSTNVIGGTASQAALALNLSAKVVSFASALGVEGSSDAAPLAVIEDAWSPDAMPTAALAEGEDVGGILIEPTALFASRTELAVDLAGTSEDIAAVLSDWTLDGSLNGYSVVPTEDGAILRYADVEDLSDGLSFTWNTAGTGVTVTGLTVIPEPLSLGLVVLVGPWLVVRRRGSR